jgi:hypothetical protein
MLGRAEGAVALTAAGGRLFAIGRDGAVWTREALVGQADWTRLYDAGGGHTLAAWAGMLIGAGDQLRWRPV